MLFERGHMRPEEYGRAKDGWAGFFDRLEARLRGIDLDVRHQGCL